jgi:hypothetical protein
MSVFLDDLKALADEGYKDFQAKLVPNIPAQKILGIRIPKLRALAKSLQKKENFRELYKDFCYELPHKYYDEDNLHVLFINDMKELDSCIPELDRILPHIDNWASCDLFKPKCFIGKEQRILPYIKTCLESPHVYTCRFGIDMLMEFFLKEHFDKSVHSLLYGFTSEEYYVNMAKAWYFASALTKQYEASVDVITDYKLDKWTHNKTIQKCMESLAIPKERKEFLKGFKLK